MCVLCTFKIKIEGQNSNYGLIKTSDHIKTKTKMQNPSQDPPGSSKATNEDSKDMDILNTFKIKIENQNLMQG